MEGTSNAMDVQYKAAAPPYRPVTRVSHELTTRRVQSTAMKPRLLIGVLLALAAGGATAARQGTAPPPVIFRAEVNYVELDAIVTDGAGNVVPDLTQADFDVL